MTKRPKNPASIKRGHESDALGLAAQSSIMNLLRVERCVVTEPHADRHGWDLLVEFPQSASTSVTSDKAPALPKVLLQVKASASIRKRSVSIALSAWEPLVKSLLPAIIVCAADPDGKFHPPGRIWLAAMDDAVMAKVLRALRKASVEGRPLNGVSYSVPADKLQVVSTNDPGLLLSAIEHLVRNQVAVHSETKARLLKKLGYAERPLSFALQIKGEDNIKRHLDAQLGINTTFEATLTDLRETRFEISVPVQGAIAVPGSYNLRIEDVAGIPCEMGIAGSMARVRGRLNVAPEAPVASSDAPEITGEWKMGFRFVSPMMTIAHLPWHKREFDLDLNISTDPIPLNELADTCSFWQEIRRHSDSGTKVLLQLNGKDLVELESGLRIPDNVVQTLDLVDAASAVAAAARLRAPIVDLKGLFENADSLLRIAGFLTPGREVEFGADVEQEAADNIANKVAVYPIFIQSLLGPWQISAVFALSGTTSFHPGADDARLRMTAPYARPHLEGLWAAENAIDWPVIERVGNDLFRRYSGRDGHVFLVPQDELSARLFGPGDETGLRPRAGQKTDGTDDR